MSEYSLPAWTGAAACLPGLEHLDSPPVALDMLHLARDDAGQLWVPEPVHALSSNPVGWHYHRTHGHKHGSLHTLWLWGTPGSVQTSPSPPHAALRLHLMPAGPR